MPCFKVEIEQITLKVSQENCSPLNRLPYSGGKKTKQNRLQVPKYPVLVYENKNGILLHKVSSTWSKRAKRVGELQNVSPVVHSRNAEKKYMKYSDNTNKLKDTITQEYLVMTRNIA